MTEKKPTRAAERFQKAQDLGPNARSKWCGAAEGKETVKETV